jgi:diaminopropionate ammonia-lyase
LPTFAQRYSVSQVYVKDESHRFGLNAFKGLGASFAMSNILQRNSEVEIFCTATDGNHGRAVAWSAKRANKKAIVFVPAGTAASRIEAIRAEGAEVIQSEGDYDFACQQAMNRCQQPGWALVQDTAWMGYEEIPAWIMAGYLTMYQELEDTLHAADHAKLDVVFLQAGVGSWAASALWYYHHRYGTKRPRLVIVEPTESDGIFYSFKKKERTSPISSGRTMMAGLNCGIPSLTAWLLINDLADASMIISDDFAQRAMRELYFPKGNDQSIVAGESGAAGVAGFIAVCSEPSLAPLKKFLALTESSSVLFYNTEGATDPVNFDKMVKG